MLSFVQHHSRHSEQHRTRPHPRNDRIMLSACFLEGRCGCCGGRYVSHDAGQRCIKSRTGSASALGLQGFGDEFGVVRPQVNVLGIGGPGCSYLGKLLILCSLFRSRTGKRQGARRFVRSFGSRKLHTSFIGTARRRLPAAALSQCNSSFECAS